jgi:DNA (cytosine-5)-methyltransferase 1
MKIGSLCTGYGGLDMAVEAFFDAETIWTCEFDKYASQVIKERINKPNHGDLKTTDWTKVEPIDILTAGYPCQPFSHAGSRKGADDERHLWPYIKEIIGILRPQFIILENVRGHFGLGFREVLSDLANLRYDARWTLIRASDVGAPHRRERLFILAHTISPRCSRTQPSDLQTQQSRNPRSNIDEYTDANGQRWPLVGVGVGEIRNQGQSQFIASELVEEIVTDANGDACTESRRTSGELRTESSRLLSRQDKRFARGFSRSSLEEIYTAAVPSPVDQGRLNVKFVEYMMGLPDGWVTDLDMRRAQMLKILGNGVVPQQAYKALELLNSYPQKLSTGSCG